MNSVHLRDGPCGGRHGRGAHEQPVGDRGSLEEEDFAPPLTQHVRSESQQPPVIVAALTPCHRRNEFTVENIF